MKTAEIKIKNLALRTVIGFNEWEREKKQDVVINALIEIDITEAAKTDSVDDSMDYKTITKKIIAEVEQSNFHLLEKLADSVLGIIMQNARVLKATVEVDKPHSLRFTESVSATVSENRHK